VAGETAGDPMSDQKWVRSSLRQLSKALVKKGYQASRMTVRRLLRQAGYSLRANRKQDSVGHHIPTGIASFVISSG
jgi:hypothetical protein